MKHVYKMLPVSVYDIPGLEQWLEEQALDGLFPVHLGTYASFRRDGTPGTRFRLEAFGRAGAELSEEQRELYRQAGWEYAMTVGQGFYLFYSTDPAAPELHTDLVTQGLSLDRLARQLRRLRLHHILFPILLAAVLAAGVLLPVSRFDVQPDRWALLPLLLLHVFDPALFLPVCALAFLYFIDLRDTRRLLGLHRRLKAGLSPLPSPGPSRAVVWENWCKLFLGVVVIVLIGGTFLSKLSVGPFAQEIPLDHFSQPYVALNDLEAEPVVSWDTLYPEDADSYHRDANTAHRSFSLLAPVWYDVSQRAYSLQPSFYVSTYSPAPENDRQRYSPTLDMTYVQLTFPGLSQTMASSLLSRMRLVNCYWTYEQVDYPGADLVILAREERRVWQLAALVRDGQIAVFRYGGREDLASHLDDLAQVFR